MVRVALNSSTPPLQKAFHNGHTPTFSYLVKTLFLPLKAVQYTKVKYRNHHPFPFPFPPFSLPPPKPIKNLILRGEGRARIVLQISSGNKKNKEIIRFSPLCPNTRKAISTEKNTYKRKNIAKKRDAN